MNETTPMKKTVVEIEEESKALIVKKQEMIIRQEIQQNKEIEF